MIKDKLLLITSEFPPQPGGIGNHAFFLSKYLQKKGFEVSILSDFRNENEDLAFDAQQCFAIHRIKRNKFTQFYRFKKAQLLVKQNQIIICSGKFSLWMGALLNSFFCKKKFIAVLHGSELRAGNKAQQALTKWSLSRFATLIAVSEFTKQYALSVDPNLSIEVINNGFEISQFENELKEKSNKLNLVTVGNLTFRKGQQNVIKALPFLKEQFPEIHYHCIGIPTEIEKFSALAQSLGVFDCITFYGILSDAERNAVLKKATIFLMLSQHVKNDFEGFGIAVLEANSLGIPAIGSRDSGIADAIKTNYSGVLVNQNDPNEVLNAVTEIMKNYYSYSVQAQEWSTHFDWSYIIKYYLKIIKHEA
ncbi:glycosyltransferase family 4 protein [Flavobacterium sp. PLA-1-15]|uniref:glycosyltransferase family 4 protein n=1 Tax=Flavobacterium sp. PLA-1-15 TaxID=3380533 RepID=UPI003B796C62